MDKNIELFKVFRGVSYLDKTHSYTMYNRNLISVTQFISRLKAPFESEYWLLYKVLQANGHSVKPYFGKNGMSTTVIRLDDFSYPIEQIIDEDIRSQMNLLQEKWNIESEIGTTRGSFAHNYLENLERGIADTPKIILPKNISTLQSVDYVNSIGLVKELCHQYIKDNQHLIPIAIEFKVADIELGLAGTFDRLYWNEQDQEYQIHDFKTDKKIDTKGKYGKLELFNLPFCEMAKYSIQTSLYKYIIEKNTSLKIGESKITHLNIKDGSLDYYDCRDYTTQIKELSNGDNWAAYIKP